MFSYIIAKLVKLDDTLDEIARLAMRHANYGVRQSHDKMFCVDFYGSCKRARANNGIVT